MSLRMVWSGYSSSLLPPGSSSSSFWYKEETPLQQPQPLHYPERLMESCWTVNSSPNRRKAANELTRGEEYTQQLQKLLKKSIGDELPSSVHDLVSKILNSFSNSITILNSSASDEASQIPVTSRENSPWKSEEDSGESCRSSTLKDRRGCYKRRKTSHAWTRESSALFDDGHAWRKYGQKAILNAKFPRHYFRCTHKTDQGCPASKQVQRIEEDPPKYRTTYYSQHTCNRFVKSPEVILDSYASDSSVFLSFDGPICGDDGAPFFSSPPLVKQETKEETPSDVAFNYSSSSDYLVSPDLSGFDSAAHFPVMLSSSLESNQGDVMSDFMVGSVDFDDLKFEI